jgi:hypothetical protein
MSVAHPPLRRTRRSGHPEDQDRLNGCATRLRGSGAILSPKMNQSDSATTGSDGINVPRRSRLACRERFTRSNHSRPGNLPRVMSIRAATFSPWASPKINRIIQSTSLSDRVPVPTGIQMCLMTQVVSDCAGRAGGPAFSVSRHCTAKSYHSRKSTVSYDAGSWVPRP